MELKNSRNHTKRLEVLAGYTHDLQDQTKAIWDKVGMPIMFDNPQI